MVVTKPRRDVVRDDILVVDHAEEVGNLLVEILLEVGVADGVTSVSIANNLVANLWDLFVESSGEDGAQGGTKTVPRNDEPATSEANRKGG